MTSEPNKKARSIKERLGIDYESQEWKEDVLRYNNRVIVKHDIESKKLLVVRRLLREGNIAVLDKENQALLAHFLDAAIEGLPHRKKERGRPHDDEIKSIELMKELSQEYNRLHHKEGLTIGKTLEELSKLAGKIGKHLSKKRIEQLCAEYNTYRPHYESQLYELYSTDKDNLKGQYRVLIGDATYTDRISSLSDCKPKELSLADVHSGKEVDPVLHRLAITELAGKYKLSDADIEKRIAWEEGPWDWHDAQEFKHNPIIQHLK